MKKTCRSFLLIFTLLFLSSCVTSQAPIETEIPVSSEQVPNSPNSPELPTKPTAPEPTIPTPAIPIPKPVPLPKPETPAPTPVPPAPTPVPPAPTPVPPAPTPVPPAPTPTPPAPVELGATITEIEIENLTSTSQTNAPFTLGHPFKKGNLLPSEGLAGKLPDGTAIPLQVDVKALHTDGSVRHAIISGVLPSLPSAEIEKIKLTKTKLASTTTDVKPQDLVTRGLTASVDLTLEGVDYRLKVDDLLKTGKVESWLKGPIANEFLVAAPFKTVSGGVAHPHLMGRFAVRSYAGTNKVKIDFVFENGWAYEPNPNNFTYNVKIKIGNQIVYTQTALTHFSHARWHKNFWFNGDPAIHIKHNVNYIIDTKAVPNYDRSLVISEATLAALKKRWDESNKGPMGNGLANKYMPATGGRPELGLNPSWAVIALLSMDKRAMEVTRGMGDLGGSWSAHYRDKNTDQPISLIDYPYMSAQRPHGDHKNPKTGKNEAFIPCPVSCSNANTIDVSHQAAFDFIPYLLTGEHYYMEELLFYSMWNVGSGNPHYRKFEKGLMYRNQVRGQAWTLRTLSDALYIVPDTHRLKSHLRSIVDWNLEDYNTRYSNNPGANIFGVVDGGSAVIYNTKKGIAPWQDDFFTAAIGHMHEHDVPNALPLLKWKAKFVVDRMTNPGACWILASNYTYNLRDSETSPFYTSFREAYVATVGPEIANAACASAEMATLVGQKQNAMVGYPSATAGFPANMHPALSYAVDAGIPNAAKAWSIFMNRASKPNYATEPQFDVVPR